MARSKRFLILLAVLAAACAAAAIALNWQQRQEQIQTSGEAVLEIDPDSVQALSWTRGELSLSFTRDEEGNWSYDDDDAFPVNPEAMEQLLSPFAPFSAAFMIEEAQDEGQYGLDEPECSIAIDTGGPAMKSSWGTPAPWTDSGMSPSGTGRSTWRWTTRWKRMRRRCTTAS